MLTSIVIATYNKLEYTIKCIESIRQYTDKSTYEIIVIDNLSTDETRAWLQQSDDLTVILNDQNLGFPKACNQGIEIANGDYVLLLNNDTVVTENWLDNLQTAIQSSPDVGAVSLVTNSCSYGQAIDVNYTTLDEMQHFSKKFNRSDPLLWEERAKLIAFCVLIRRSVLENVGFLDERFTPGNFEDDDLSLRIRLAGYKLLLCKDTFIHHYGSVSFGEASQKYIQLMKTNQKKFEEKWGLSPERAFGIELNLVRSIEALRDEPLKILHVGSGLGATLLATKTLFPNAQLYAWDNKELGMQLFQKSSEMTAFNRDDFYSQTFFEVFDIILLSDPEFTIDGLHRLLKSDGELIAEYHHLLNYAIIQQIIVGTIRNQHKIAKTYDEVESLFRQANFEKINIQGLVDSEMKEQDDEFVRAIGNMFNQIDVSHLRIIKLLVKAQKSEVPLKLLSQLKRIDGNEDENAIRIAIEVVEQNNVEAITRVIDRRELLNKSQILNVLVFAGFQTQNFDILIPLLQKSLIFDPQHNDTLFNLSIVHNHMGERELAIQYALQIQDRSEQVENWLKELGYSIP